MTLFSNGKFGISTLGIFSFPQFIAVDDDGNDILKGQSGFDVLYGNLGMAALDGGSENDNCYDSANDLIVNCE